MLEQSQDIVSGIDRLFWAHWSIVLLVAHVTLAAAALFTYNSVKSVFGGNLLERLGEQAEQEVSQYGHNATQLETLRAQVAKYRRKVKARFTRQRLRLLIPLTLGAIIPFGIVVFRVSQEAGAQIDQAILFSLDQVARGVFLDIIEIFELEMFGSISIGSADVSWITKVSMVLLRYLWETIFLFSTVLIIFLWAYLRLIMLGLGTPERIKSKQRQIQELLRQQSV